MMLWMSHCLRRGHASHRSLAASGTDSSSSSEVERGCRRLQRRIAASSTDTRSNVHTSRPGKEEEKVWEDIALAGPGGEVGCRGSDRGNAARESAWTRSAADMHAGGAQELGPESLETLQVRSGVKLSEKSREGVLTLTRLLCSGLRFLVCRLPFQ